MDRIWRNVFMNAMKSNRGQNVIQDGDRRIIVPQAPDDFIAQLKKAFAGVPLDPQLEQSLTLKDIAMNEDYFLAYPDETKLRPWMNRVEQIMNVFDNTEFVEKQQYERMLDPQVAAWTTVQTLGILLISSFAIGLTLSSL